jgi:hypothetical protein
VVVDVARRELRIGGPNLESEAPATFAHRRQRVLPNANDREDG